jgi:hypothetical protein
MYINQNPMLQGFNAFKSQNPNMPFNNNQLLYNNPIVMNNFNNLQQAKNNNIKQNNNNKQNNKTGKNIIEELLKPAVIEDKKNTNKDVDASFRSLKSTYGNKESVKNQFKLTTDGYKTIIKDSKYIPKNTSDIKSDKDLIVHKVTKADANKDEIESKHRVLEKALHKHTIELVHEYGVEKENHFKKKFDDKQSFIMRLKYNSTTHGDLKEDHIEFYKQQQEKLTKDEEDCNRLLRQLENSGLLKDEEKPE